jgi:hypothetical protein
LEVGKRYIKKTIYTVPTDKTIGAKHTLDTRSQLDTLRAKGGEVQLIISRQKIVFNFLKLLPKSCTVLRKPHLKLGR